MTDKKLKHSNVPIADDYVDDDGVEYELIRPDSEENIRFLEGAKDYLDILEGKKKG